MNNISISFARLAVQSAFHHAFNGQLWVVVDPDPGRQWRSFTSTLAFLPNFIYYASLHLIILAQI
jgi:hypothetical protein